MNRKVERQQRPMTRREDYSMRRERLNGSSGLLTRREDYSMRRERLNGSSGLLTRREAAENPG